VIWNPRHVGPIRIRLYGKQNQRQAAITQFFRRLQ
jgi:hypothetical protein